MCVGAQRPRAPPSALLLLGLALGSAAKLTCTGDTYPQGGKCCHDCRPGFGMVERCTSTQDSVCRECAPGFYNEATNYQPCKLCTWCNARSGSETRRACTPTSDTVCSCRPGTQPRGNSFKRGVDCTPCLPGHFSPGNNEACRPWTNCSLAGKHTLQAASSSSDAVCEDRTPPAPQPSKTPGPPTRPSTAQPTTAWTPTSQPPTSPPTEPPRGPQLAAVLGLGLGLGLLAPMAAALILLLHYRARRPSSGFRKPIQEEHSDAHSTLAKL
ncbi:tumor necrosis factor receptor superfamily member 4 isoform X2 [Pipistrellus kuhlii]|uniref:Tumor necrosis factor receptor superfamily member 4 n=1 Tax=Pipistrellus kuhlii TaxID=59472 RepID=A0A7J7QUZ4_PIPKU|nr:tumor necrosis factor receptor superfamily member 4 isoform X2 [Pipistrellus kuhlii]KAF6267656.1 TNF receptor superfamily member 4 [Pipistrellus kuhlii]